MKVGGVDSRVAELPVLFICFPRRLVPSFKVTSSSVHAMASVGKRCSCTYAIRAK